MRNPLTLISEKIVRSLEDFFEWYGVKVASHPFIVIIGCVLVTGAAVVGVVNYREENNAFKLWIPDNSDFVENNEWLLENSPMDIRFHSVILSSPGGNILKPEVLQHISKLRNKVDTFVTSGNELTWTKQCFKREVLKYSFKRMDIDIPYPGVCDFLDVMLELECFETSILEFWPRNFDFDTIRTIDEVLNVVNNASAVSSTFKTPISIDDYIGGKILRKNGQVVSAEAMSMKWFGHINLDSLTEGDYAAAASGDAVDAASLEWEEKLIEVLEEDRNSLPNNVETYINVARAYGDVAGETIMNDAIMMPIGFMIVFVYVTIMLGKFNCVEQRALLALGGIACIGLTVGFTYGFCSAIGLFYGPMHNIIPFLLLGIGIDDMFVIMQCYDNLGVEKTDSYIRNMGLTLRHAGVAITVTSFTDFIVFALGATTVLPALRSFCLWCSVGIVAVYFFQATLFTTFLSLDCRRLVSNRNGLCPFYIHDNENRQEKLKDEKENSSFEYSFAQKIFAIFSKCILSIPGMITVTLVTLGLLASGVYGLVYLEQEFDPIWFLPPSADVYQWFTANSEYFPSKGEEVTVYITEVDWEKDMDKIGELVQKLKKATDIIESVDEWHTDLVKANISKPCVDYQGDFKSLLTCFLFSNPRGFASQRNFKYVNNSDIQCGSPAPEVLLSTFTFVHKRFDGRDEHIPALNKVKDIFDEVKFSKGKAFPISREYSNWETDEVITLELIRNLGLAVASVFLTTLILLANFMGSIYVLVCVALTLVNLCGYIHYWGLTIDVVSSVNIIIAIGLCVDYSAHVCHTFLTVSGSRKERAMETLVRIGPAVLNGGVSTFIAFILLAGSDSHVFSSFFRIFFLVVVIGLFHGLVVLPVMLRIGGPRSYSTVQESQITEKKKLELENIEKL